MIRIFKKEPFEAMKNETAKASLVTCITERKEDFYRLAYSYVKNKDDALDIVQESIQKR